jgi:hypothetical protein
MRPLGLVELQRVGDAVDHALGDAGGGAALEAGVVLDRDAGEEGGLFAPQALDPPTGTAVYGQPGLLRADPGSSRGQELPDLAESPRMSPVSSPVPAIAPAYECSGVAGGPCEYPCRWVSHVGPNRGVVLA